MPVGAQGNRLGGDLAAERVGGDQGVRLLVSVPSDEHLEVVHRALLPSLAFQGRSGGRAHMPQSRDWPGSYEVTTGQAALAHHIKSRKVMPAIALVAMSVKT